MHRSPLQKALLNFKTRPTVVQTAQRSKSVKTQDPHPFEHGLPLDTKPKESAFKFDTTFTLIKKMVIYRMMSSNLFINYSLTGMSLAYRLIGIKVTNKIIESTAGSIFTGGVTIDDLLVDMDLLEKRNIGSISMMVVEGLKNADEATLDYFYTISRETVQQMTDGRPEAHFALKLTAFISLELME
jgi:hypothetical protein